MDRDKIYSEICKVKKRLDYDSNEIYVTDLMDYVEDEKIIYESNDLSNAERSHIIESALLGFSPKIAIRRFKDKIEVLLGDNIIDSIVEFVNNNFELEDMLFLSELNGCKHNDIKDILRCDVRIKSLKTYTIEKNLTPNEIDKLTQLMKGGI